MSPRRRLSVGGIALGVERLEPRCLLDATAIAADWLAAHGPAPYYLNNANTSYVLQSDVHTPGTAFVLTAPNIQLDLNGHTVTYGDAPPVVVANGDFEDGLGSPVSGWDFSAAPDAEVIAGTFVQPVQVYSGGHSLRFSVPGGDQHVRSTQTVTLSPRTTYTLSLMVYNRVNDGTTGVNEITLYAELEGTAIRAGLTGITWRGFQYVTAQFTTGATAQTYTIRAGVAGAGAAAEASLYIDDIRVQPYGAHGIVVGPESWNAATQYPDVQQFGGAAGASITNGSIVQGSAAGQFSGGVFVNNSAQVNLGSLDVSVYGADSRDLYLTSSSQFAIHNNVLRSSVTTISSRDHFDGALITARNPVGGEIRDNQLLGGCQAGIYLNGQSAATPVLIHDNYLALSGRYANDFAIQLWNDVGTRVYDNVIDNAAAGRSGRGIGIGGPSQGTRVYNNVISVQETAVNQEYDGVAMGGAYGIQVEGLADIEIYGNVVTAKAVAADAAAFRINSSPTLANIHVHDNTFTAVKTGAGFNATALSIEGIAGAASPLRFENNHLTSNARWLEGSYLSSLELRGTTLAIGSDPEAPFEPLVAAYWEENNPAAAIQDIRFVDNQYADAAAAAAYQNTSIYWKFYADLGVDPLSSFLDGATVYLSVTRADGAPLAGAAVTILDAGGGQVFSGTTGASGALQTLLDGFRDEGGVRSSFNPYTLSVSRAGFETWSQPFTVNGPQTLAVRLAALTATTLSSSTNPAGAGQPIVLTATVAGVDPAASVPTGTVEFRDGGTVLRTVTLSAGRATMTTSSLAIGAHALTAVYNPGTYFRGSTSPALGQTVIVNPLSSFDVQQGASQRSYVRYVDLAFAAAADLGYLISGGGLRLTRFNLDGSGGTTVSLSGVVTANGNGLHFDFGVQGIGGNRNTADGDGYYELAMDLDHSGAFATRRHFFRLLGDASGDGRVNLADYGLVKATYGSSGAGDLNGSGTVNLADFGLLKSAYGRYLASGLPWDD